MRVRLKDILLVLLKRFDVTTRDLIKADIVLQYPDLVNRIVEAEERVYFSEVCVDYLKGVEHQAAILNLNLGHLLQKYLNPRGLYFSNDVLNTGTSTVGRC